MDVVGADVVQQGGKAFVYGRGFKNIGASVELAALVARKVQHEDFVVYAAQHASVAVRGHVLGGKTRHGWRLAAAREGFVSLGFHAAGLPFCAVTSEPKNGEQRGVGPGIRPTGATVRRRFRHAAMGIKVLYYHQARRLANSCGSEPRSEACAGGRQRGRTPPEHGGCPLRFFIKSEQRAGVRPGRVTRARGLCTVPP